MEKITTHTYTDKVLAVPFFGYQDALPVGYEKATTSCGMCCIAMILQFKGKNISLINLVEKGYADGGYSKNGWVHQYFVDTLAQYELPSARKENIPRQAGIAAIKESIENGNPVVISGRKLFMEQTSFHMVLVVGIRTNENNDCIGFFYHDPALPTEEKGANHFVTIESFMQYWRQMAIVLE